MLMQYVKRIEFAIFPPTGSTPTAKHKFPTLGNKKEKYLYPRTPFSLMRKI
jgi:hypothetical protein